MRVQGVPYRTIWMEEDRVKLIYQPILPHVFEIRECSTYQDTAIAIKDMWIRGAPAIGAAGAYGMVQAIAQAPADGFMAFILEAAQTLEATRPTAQNLFFGVQAVLKAIQKASSKSEALEAAHLAAETVVERDIKACQRIGELGNGLIQEGDAILTHCNAGWLACVDWGTALSPIYHAANAGKKPFVFVDETRPRGQGARLTAWELSQEGVAHAVIADNAAGHFMSQKQIQCVIVGADRIARNGDVANKIGTFNKAVAAHACGIPFYVAAPMSTVDFQCPTGVEIPIEERSSDEVHYTWGQADSGEVIRVRTTPKASDARNPAFDVTPAHFITGIITEEGVFPPHELQSLSTE